MEQVSYQLQSLGPLANVDETRQWLTNNRFAPYVSLFANYGGTDLLRLSRKDLMDLCGPADGIRLYNALHIRSVKRIYISFEEGTAYNAIFLEELTAAHFKDCIARRLSIAPSVITAIQLQHTYGYGILVNVDDLVSKASIYQ
ncbi:PREDICTED: transcription factor CP2-like [Amphimedon queenslandica]|uniref:SAM domain-containing protein n=1 Tax=Amphimedon queenslandica TaxID=400682 RepID=A0AAN0IYM0_AMPQE|nr:PREDICTED: transcription factor CP2-like [Amphimedon queenslandica]|eukprot:XP_019849642.1 PREDICTED: transcription factor CP2-like [Amphimedon queenslandica]